MELFWVHAARPQAVPYLITRNKAVIPVHGGIFHPLGGQRTRKLHHSTHKLPEQDVIVRVIFTLFQHDIPEQQKGIFNCLVFWRVFFSFVNP